LGKDEWETTEVKEGKKPQGKTREGTTGWGWEKSGGGDTKSGTLGYGVEKGKIAVWEKRTKRKREGDHCSSESYINGQKPDPRTIL